MNNEEKKQAMQENPKEAEFGRGAPGNEHYGVNTAQTTEVNPPEEKIPSGADVEKNKDQLEAFRKQEEASGVDTTGKDSSGGYTLDDAGNLNVVAVEPEMYVEEDK